MHDLGFFKVDEIPPGADERLVLMKIFKGIIDNEWGPYDDDFYGEMADQALELLMSARRLA